MLDFERIQQVGEARRASLQEEAIRRRMFGRGRQGRSRLAPVVVRCANLMIAGGEWLIAQVQSQGTEQNTAGTFESKLEY